MHTFDPMAKKRGSYLFDQLAAAHRSRAAAEGQKRDLVPGIPGPQRRPEGDKGRYAGCLDDVSITIGHSASRPVSPGAVRFCSALVPRRI